jgi:hypothetical protein
MADLLALEAGRIPASVLNPVCLAALAAALDEDLALFNLLLEPESIPAPTSVLRGVQAFIERSWTRPLSWRGAFRLDIPVRAIAIVLGVWFLVMGKNLLVQPIQPSAPAPSMVARDAPKYAQSIEYAPIVDDGASYLWDIIVVDDQGALLEDKGAPYSWDISGQRLISDRLRLVSVDDVGSSDSILVHWDINNQGSVRGVRPAPRVVSITIEASNISTITDATMLYLRVSSPHDQPSHSRPPYHTGVRLLRLWLAIAEVGLSSAFQRVGLANLTLMVAGAVVGAMAAWRWLSRLHASSKVQSILMGLYFRVVEGDK